MEKTGPLGVGIQDKGGKAIIGQIKDEGLLAKFNKTAGDNVVKTNDEIVAVNGKAGNKEEIQKAIGGATGLLKLEIKRA